MKKYLMTGIAALALGAGFTSCSHDIEPITQEDLNKIEAQKVVDNYNQAFIKTFGQPAANQTWGFGTSMTRAFTRAHDDGRIDVNGNEWKTKPEVTAAEARAVFDYVNRVKTSIPHYSETAPENLTTYYCTQVWGGNNHVESDVADERTYPNYDQKRNGQSGNVYGPSKMNNLHIAMSTDKGEIGIDDNGNLVGDWVHINNFNASENTNYGGNTGVTNGGTLDFAYQSSEDSKYHNKWIIIDGQYITDSEGVNHAGKYYVCFDFYSCKNDVYTNFQKPGTGNVEVPGAYATTADAIAAGAKDRNGNLVQSNWSIGNVVGGNMCIPANDIYTDWIIRLVNATPIVNNDYDIRVIAEDLNAASTTDKVNSDWDFNDVVFDVKYLDTPVDGKNVKIRVVAAGGTYPLYVAGQEVHALFGQSTNVMINTKASAYGRSYETQELPVFYIKDDNAKSTNGKSIMVEVDKGSGKIEMTAEVGKPAAKIGVSPNFNYCMERVDITTEYPLFQTWVTTATPATGWWDSEIGK